jgi:acetylornithine deacetylase/succinyl-diaminopimelate desuccinylase-like protein
LMPTIQITWLQSGYTGEWYRNAIPHKTTIKINFRFARWQKPADAIAQFIARANEQTPNYVDIEFDISDSYEAITIETNHPSVQKASSTLLSSHGKEPVLRFCGAAIPVTWLFQDILGSAVVIVDLANEDCRMHGVGENFKITCIQKWLDFSEQFFST